MQTLFFEPSWDKTIAQADREKITDYFQSRQFGNGVHFSYLWEAVNHQDELLITVLIHNAEDTPLTIKDTVISYLKNSQETRGLFTIPVSLPEKTTMPWTFIFSPSNQTSRHPMYFITNENN